jgi:hypothetical protein
LAKPGRGRWIAVILGVGVVAGLVGFMVRAGLRNIVGSGQAYLDKAAVSSLWAMHWAEKLYREGGYADRDGDGIGEFGTLGQLAGESALPSGARLPASLLSLEGSPRVAPGGALMEAAGTCFLSYLPDDPDGAERGFVLYAWPARATGGGSKVFCINQYEDILEADASARGYFGCDRPPPRDACIGPEAASGAPPTDGLKGDGAPWKRWKGKTSRKYIGAR